MDQIDPRWIEAFEYLKRRAEGFGKTPFDHPSDYFTAIETIGKAAKETGVAPHEDFVRKFFVDAGWSQDAADKIANWPDVAVGALKA